MTKAITLESKIEQFRDALYDGWGFGDYREGIPDVNVMIQLGCTPQSWSRYRPLLIQHCLKNELIKDETRDGMQMETIRLEIRYDRKKKLWYGRQRALRIHDETYGYREMTEEELAKYNLIWNESEFLY
ncbi:MAG: hypothetical protein H8D35_05580 [Nitrosopumilus sp.]|nr:hypothetical protein [Nitrosopumilus sp.]MBL7015217.1 hypothetical protein [Nitrosopumilus sp.]